MSNVTNIILVCSLSENTDYLYHEFQNIICNGNPFNIVSVDDKQPGKGWYGGTKNLECNIYIGAYNYLDLDRLIIDLKQINWEDPELVQLIVMGQNDMKFRIIDLFGSV